MFGSVCIVLFTGCQHGVFNEAVKSALCRPSPCKYNHIYGQFTPKVDQHIYTIIYGQSKFDTRFQRDIQVCKYDYFYSINLFTDIILSQTLEIPALAKFCSMAAIDDQLYQLSTSGSDCMHEPLTLNLSLSSIWYASDHSERFYVAGDYLMFR